MTGSTPAFASRRDVLKGVAAVGGSLILPAALEAAAEAGRIVVAQPADLISLDPFADASPYGLCVFRNVYEQLTEIGQNGTLIPMLATDWQPGADLMSWIFTIRPNAKFQNGDPVTTDDVVWTYSHAMADLQAKNHVYTANIAAVEALPGNKVKFSLKVKFATLPRLTSLVSILPKAVYERMGAAEFARHPVGSGYYAIKSWQRDNQLEMQAVAQHWSGTPAIKTVVIRPVPADASRVSGMIAGDLDIIPSVPPALVSRLEARSGIKIIKVVSNRSVYLTINHAMPLVSTLKIRQAIDHAIDRNAICTRLLRGLAEPSGQMATPVVVGYDKNIQPTKYDPDLSRKLLKDANYAGEKIPFLRVSNRFASSDEVAQAVMGYMNQVGINVDPITMEYAAAFQLSFAKKLPALYLGAFNPSMMDSELILSTAYESTGTGYWTSPAIDILVAQQRAEADPVKRDAIISQIYQRAKEDVAHVHIYYEIQAYGENDRVEWRPNSDQSFSFRHAKLTGK